MRNVFILEMEHPEETVEMVMEMEVMEIQMIRTRKRMMLTEHEQGEDGENDDG